MNFAQFGNDLYTGKRSVDFVGRYKTWYAVSAVLLLIAMSGLLIRQLNLGIEFTGGSDYRIASVKNFDNYEPRVRDIVLATGGVPASSVTRIGADQIRVTTDRFDDDKAQVVKNALAKEFQVTPDEVQFSVIGPSWGASVSKQALQALLWFLALVALVLGVYFRTWKMALAALVALFHDIFFTVGVYALAGLEVTPASMIGFLTILGYSLYDTVVVFDKVRENTDEARASGRKTYSDAANLAVNQTLVRSINTTVVALLPVSALLLVGIFVLGPGTLLDLSVALFIGIAVGAYSSIFIATPLLAQLREREPEMQALAKRVGKQRAKVGTTGTVPGARVPVTAGAGGAAGGGVGGGPMISMDAAASAASANPNLVSPGESTHTDEDGVERTVTGRPIHPDAKRGPRNQPRRPPKSKR